MKIAFIGTGYVGLVTGAVFAGYGYDVYCVDVDEKRIAELKNGNMPFYEPGLDELVKKGVAGQHLFFTTQYEDAVPNADAVFICVGTPPKADGTVNLSYLEGAAEMVAKHLVGYTVIAIKSTVPIGVEDELDKIIREHKSPDSEYEFASVPEFLQEGTALENTMHPDRLVFGVKSDRAQDVLLSIHKHISGERIVTDVRSAQMIKYAANSFLAIKVSYANAVATIAEKLGANAKTVLYGMGLDKRIGQAYFRPGVGFGGSCLPKDTQAFYNLAKSVGYDFSLVKAAFDTNEGQIASFVDKLQSLCGGSIAGKTIALLGLAFKPDTDDIREAVAVKLLPKLLAAGAKIKACDPVAIPHVKAQFPESEQLQYTADPMEAITGADVLFLVTEWQQFKELDLAAVKTKMQTPILLDGRNVFDPQAVKALGFTYAGVGVA